MWCIFQDCEGLSNIADNTHTLHRVLFCCCVPIPIVQRVKPDPAKRALSVMYLLKEEFAYKRSLAPRISTGHAAENGCFKFKMVSLYRGI